MDSEVTYDTPLSEEYTKERGKKRGYHFKPVQQVPWKYLTRQGRRIRKRVEDHVRQHSDH